LWLFEFLPNGFFSHLIARLLQQSQPDGASMKVQQYFKDALLLQGHDLKMVLRIIPLQLKSSSANSIQNVLSVQVRSRSFAELTIK